MNAELQPLIDRLVQELQPEEILLFGSHARGTAHAGSDYDLLALVPESTPEYKRKLNFTCGLALDLNIAADVLATTRAKFDRYKGVVGSLSYRIAKEGKLIYVA